jgi:WD40 repeat protein
MFKKLVLLVLMVGLAIPLMPNARPAHAQIPSCTIPDGTRVIPALRNGDLVLLNLRTAEIVGVVEAGLAPEFTTTITVRGWTPNCEVVLINLRGSVVAAWNVETGQRLGQIRNAQMRPATLSFSPDNRFVFAQPNRGSLLWDLGTGRQYELTTAGVASVRTYTPSRQPVRGVTWDLAHGEMFIVRRDIPNAVTAYNLETGEISAIYSAGENADNVSYRVAGSDLLVFAARPIGDERAFLYNRTTGASIQLDLNAVAGGAVRYLAPSYIGRGPGNTLVLSHRDLYVFDLDNFDGGPLAPTVRLPVRSGAYPVFQFATDTLIDAYYYSSGFAFEVWRWDASTGEEIASNGFRVSTCDNAEFRATYAYPDLLDFACSAR